MTDESDKTVKIRRNAKVGTDDRGRTVWTKPIEDVELELVSTTMLEQLLATGDESQRERMRALAESGDGILAMDTTSRQFETITDAELESALRSGEYEKPADVSTGRAEPKRGKPAASAEPAGEAEELSLVTTQMLRKILAGEDPAEEDAKDTSDGDKPKRGGGGYNPYDRG